MKRINRKALLAWLVEKTGTEFSMDNFADRNSFFLCNKDSSGFTEEVYQLEFIPASKDYFFTILFSGICVRVTKDLNVALNEYVKDLKLGRTICVDTLNKTDLIYG